MRKSYELGFLQVRVRQILQARAMQIESELILQWLDIIYRT